MKEKKQAFINNDYQVSSKRFLASFFDAVILSVLTFLILLLLNSVILPNLNSYKKASNQVNEASMQMRQISNDAKIVKYNDAELETPLTKQEMFEEFALSQIKLSYEKDSTIFPEEPSLEGVVAASFDEDQFSYFYVSYVPNHNENNNIVNYQGKEPKVYYLNIIKNTDVDLAIFNEVNVETLDYPTIKTSVAVAAYKVLVNNSKDTSEIELKNKLESYYNKLWEKASEELSNSSIYQEQYKLYKTGYLKLSQKLFFTNILGYLISVISMVLLPQFLTSENHQTFGLRMTKSVLTNGEKESAKPWQIIVRTVVLFFSNLPTLLIASFFSGGLNAGLAMPIWDRGLSLLQILIFTCVFPVINMLFVMYSRTHSSPAELISRTLILDLNNYNDVEPVKKEEKIGNDGNVNLVVTDIPYVDSSTIPEDKKI